MCVCVRARIAGPRFLSLSQHGQLFGQSYLSPSELVRLSLSVWLAGKHGGIFSTVKANSYKQGLSSDRRYRVLIMSSSQYSGNAFRI